MKMPTNDERRDVAARLREEAERHCDGFDPLALMDALGIDMDAEPFCDGFHRYYDLATFETWNRLADLIEPEPERTTTRHGKFKTKYGNRVPLCECCGYSIGDKRYNYCPNCGAKVVE